MSGSESPPSSAVRPRQGEVRRRQLEAHIAAVEAAYGRAVVARLSEGLPADLPEWVPEDLVTEFVEALLSGPMGDDPALLVAHAHAMVDLGFAEVHATLLDVATLSMMLRYAGALWSGEVGSGRMVGFSSEASGTLVLHDHRWTESRAMRYVIAHGVERALRIVRPSVQLSFDPTPGKTLEMTLSF